MEGVMELEIKPLGRLSLKPPQPFTAGIHGPGSVGSTLSYPMPSTVAGLIAEAAYRSGDCSPEPLEPSAMEANPFIDTEECVKAALGDSARLYTGILRGPKGQPFIYLNGPEMPLLDTREPLRCPLQELGHQESSGCTKCPRIKAVRHRVIGIALHRRQKSVREGLFYSLEYITYDPPAAITALIAGAERKPSLPPIAKVGAKTGVAGISFGETTTAEPVEAEPGTYKALLIAPALLQETPLPSGVIPLASKQAFKELGARLLEAAGLQGRAEVNRVPKGEHELGITSPGWSLAYGRPRPPLLLVPPGTLLTITLEKRAKALALKPAALLLGLGCCSRLGWGTVLLVRAPDRGP